MDSMRQIVRQAKEYWSQTREDSTIRCQGCYFEKFLQKAMEMEEDSVTQNFFDAFMADAKSPATRFSRLQVITAVDKIAGTLCHTEKGMFLNEPSLPTQEETDKLFSSAELPITGGMDTGALISRAISDVAQLSFSKGLQRQYKKTWLYLRSRIYHATGSFLYCPTVVNSYISEITSKIDYYSPDAISLYVKRKAAVIIADIAETGHYKWHLSPCNPVQPLSSSELESIRQELIAGLKLNNYAENTIRHYDLFFRNIITFSGIHSCAELLAFDQSRVKAVMDGLGRHYSSMDTPVVMVRLIFRYLYEKKYTKLNCEPMVMKPYAQNGILPSYIPKEADAAFFEGLQQESKRNTAILLLARRLGLRSGDICDLTFQQVDWKEDKIRLHQNKTGDPLVLPLLPDVGNALMEYILNERPKIQPDYPYIFLRSVPPYTKLVRLYEISRSFLERTGIETVNGTKKGMHLYRRTLINRLLNEKVPHQVITDTLGHRSMESDKAYLPMEEDMLQECALGLEMIGTKQWEEVECNG